MLWLPNFLTSLRLAAAPLVVWLLYVRSFRAALFTVLGAGLTDWFDGYAARKVGASGRLGVVFDPMADKFLLVAVYIAMGLLGLIPFWLFLLVVGRDIVIVTGVALLRWLRNRRKFLPSLVGKVSTFFQIVLALLTLVEAAYPHRWVDFLKTLGIILTALFTAWSGWEYVRTGIRMAKLPPVEAVELS